MSVFAIFIRPGSCRNVDIDLSGCDGATINMITVQCNDPNPGEVNFVFLIPAGYEIDFGGSWSTRYYVGLEIQANASIGSFPI